MIRAWWQAFAEGYNRLALRERAVSLLAVLAATYLLWSLVYLAPVGLKIEETRNALRTADSRILDLETQEQLYREAATEDPNASHKQKIKQLREQLGQLDEELQALSVGLVPAERLSQVLHDLVSGMNDLELLGMETLPVERLALRNESMAAVDEKNAGQANVFRHAVEVKLRGDYFSVMRYLGALEDLPWRLYWDSLDYQVQQYPRAAATLQVYTLSAGEGVLGE